jgi:D-psicose/D-tagatose/L-ribulose 3-epimerase
MKFGLNLLLWSGDLHDGLLPILEQLKEIGYDGVELPMFNLDEEKYAAWGKRLDDLGLGRTGVTVRGVEDNPISPDPAVRAKGVEANKRTLDCCRAAGATHLVGPYHSALGYFTGQGPTPDEWKWGVESAREIAEYAGQLDIMLGIGVFEPLRMLLLKCIRGWNSLCEGRRSSELSVDVRHLPLSH